MKDRRSMLDVIGKLVKTSMSFLYDPEIPAKVSQ